MTYLVTGGAGYIGSHTTIELLNDGHDVVVLDNLSNASADAIDRIESITGKKVVFIEGDTRDADALSRLFATHNIEAVLHFAGLKAVGESVEKPLAYYDNNVTGSQTLLRAMEKAGVYQLVFSSSATVYGEPQEIPISEQCPVGRPTNPYGRSKLMVEDILQDTAISHPQWRIAILRYFNPTGAHKSGLIGENPRGIPNNLVPYIAKVASKELDTLSVFGNDYPTKDGTGIRDYIHVVDLAQGHLAALRYIQQHTGAHIWNLGTGKGYSVLDMVKAFETASEQTIAYRFAPRRAGDIAECYADPSLAKRQLGWEAQKDLKEMMEDAWRWQSNVN